MRTGFGLPSDQFAAFGRPAKVLHRAEAEQELSAKGCAGPRAGRSTECRYEAVPSKWRYPTNDWSEELHQHPHGNDQRGKQIEAIFHARHPSPEPADEPDAGENSSSARDGPGGPLAAKSMAPERVMRRVHDWEGQHNLSSERHHQVMVGQLLPRTANPMASQEWERAPAEALMELPIPPLGQSREDGSPTRWRLAGVDHVGPEPVHSFFLWMQLQIGTQNQLGQARRGIAEWLELQPECVELSVSRARAAQLPGAGTAADVRIMVPTLPASVPRSLAQRLEALRQAVLGGGLELGGVAVTKVSQIQEMASSAAAGVPRRVREAAAPLSVKTGEEGHAWREFERFVSKPAVPDSRPLSHQVLCANNLAIQCGAGCAGLDALPRCREASAARCVAALEGHCAQKVQQLPGRWLTWLGRNFNGWRNAQFTKATTWFRSVLQLRITRSRLWRHWRCTAAELKHTRGNMRTALRRITTDVARSALNVWRLGRAQGTYKQKMVGAAVLQWATGRVAFALSALKSDSSVSRHTNNRLVAAVRTLKYRQQTIALQQWWALKLRSSRLESVAKRAMRRIMLRGVSKAWVSWLDSAREQGRMKRAMRACVLRLINREMSKAFYTWRVAVATHHRILLLGKKVLVRMLQGALVRALGTWRANTTQNEALKTVRQAVMRMLNSKLTAAFNTWREHASQQKDELLKVGGALRRLVSQALCAGWNTWRTNASDRKAQEKAVRRGLMRIVNAKLAACFGTWRENAAQLIEETRILGGAVRRLLNHALSGAWNTLWENTVGAKQQGQALRRGLMRMFQGNLGAGFNSWRENAAQQAYEIHTMGGAIRRLVNRLLSAAWEQWQGTASGNRKGRQQLNHAACNLANRLLGMAWRTWQENANELREYQARIMSVVRKWQSRDVFRAFDTWRETAEEARMTSLGLATAHWAVRATVTAFMSWRILAAQTMVVTGWWGQNGVKSAFGKWNTRAGSLHLFDPTMHLMGGDPEVKSAYTGWLSTLRFGRERGLLVMWAAVWWSITQLRVNLVRWVCAARNHSDAGQIITYAARFWADRQMHACLYAWRIWARPLGEVGRLSIIAQGKSHKHDRTKLSDAMRQWRWHAAGSEMERLAETRVQQYGMLRPQRVAAFRQWRVSIRNAARVQKSLAKLEGNNISKLPNWAKHRLNWGLEVWRKRAPRGVGGLAYSSATLAAGERSDWADTMSQFYLGLRSPAAYRRMTRRSNK